MFRLASSCVALAFVGALSAQGAPFKDEVDGLVRNLRDTAHPDGSLGDGTALMTARILTAMGHCHRFYAVHDGPVVKPALNALFKHRAADGSFVDAGQDAVLVTRTVVEALEVMGEDAFRPDLAQARTWLQRAGAEAAGPFAALIAEVRQKPPEPAALKQLAGSVRGGLLQTADGKSDLARSVEALQRLVAMQVVSRAADKGAGERPKPVAAAAEPWTAAQQKALDLLLKSQKEGKFLAGPPGKEMPDLGLTAMGLAALQTKPASLRTKDEQTVIDLGLDWILAAQTKSGSIGQDNVNYVTCAGMHALARSKDPRFAEALQKAQKFILSLQNVDDRGYGPGDRDYGSIGYGGDERGDLSNLQFAIEALRASGLPDKDEALQKAIVFLQRTQNLSKVNDFKGKVRDDESGTWYSVTSGDDGGAAYYPGNSPMGYVELPDGTKVPRSYGSMTYCLLKTYTLCGVPPTDPRVRAVVGWIEKNWTLAENPGADVRRVGEKGRYQGLYYYYMVMAQALDLVGQGDWTSPTGTVVSWRTELRKHLEALQRPDGSWVNDKNPRWWEGMPTLCTIYALLALEKCK